jgi:hypothetical protein
MGCRQQNRGVCLAILGLKPINQTKTANKQKMVRKIPPWGLKPHLISQTRSLTGWAKGAGVIILAVKMYLFLQLIWNSLFELYWLANVIY